MLRRPPYDRCALRGNETSLTMRQKIGLVVGTSLTAEMLVEMPDEKINFEFFKENNVNATVLRAASISVAQLKQRGLDHPKNLKSLGFSTLHLLDEAFCADCVGVYGADALLAEFFQSSSDSVILAGSPAVSLLGLDVGLLLLLCNNEPAAAREVLVQCLPRGAALRDVPPVTILETCITASELIKLGYTSESVRTQSRATPEQLKRLGF